MPAQIDHFLVANVQKRMTGENTHAVNSLLHRYYGIWELARSDQSWRNRFSETERNLRQFCMTGCLSAPGH